MLFFHETQFPFINCNVKLDFCDYPSSPMPITTDLQGDSPLDITTIDLTTTSLQANDHSSSSSSSGNPPTPSPSVICNSRPKRQPSWLSDFVLNQVTISNLLKPCASSAILNISFLQFSVAHVKFLARLSDIQEPHSYEQVANNLSGFKLCRLNWMLWSEITYGKSLLCPRVRKLLVQNEYTR